MEIFWTLLPWILIIALWGWIIFMIRRRGITLESLVQRIRQEWKV